MNGPQEVDGSLVVTSGDGTVLLEPSEEVLDQMSSLVQMPVVVAPILARAARGITTVLLAMSNGTIRRACAS